MLLIALYLAALDVITITIRLAALRLGIPQHFLL